jgi:hypothetical protein
MIDTKYKDFTNFNQDSVEGKLLSGNSSSFHQYKERRYM